MVESRIPVTIISGFLVVGGERFGLGERQLQLGVDLEFELERFGAQIEDMEIGRAHV